MSNNARYSIYSTALSIYIGSTKRDLQVKTRRSGIKLWLAGEEGVESKGSRGNSAKGQRRRRAELARPSRGLFAGLQGLGRAKYEVL